MKKIALRKQFTNKIAFTANAEEGVLELHVYDIIGADWFGEGITANGISDAIKEAGDYNKILVRINSPGGDAFEGVTICNLLRAQGKPVDVIVDGLAASAASVIACAGDTVTMNPGSVFMIHNAMSMAFGYADDMRKEADVLDTVSSSIADIYVSATDLSKAEVQKLMDAESWMDPEETVEKGFADSIGTGKSKAKAVAADFDLSVYNNVPEDLKPRTSIGTLTVRLDVDKKIVVSASNPPEMPAPQVVEPDPRIDLYRKRIEISRAK